MNRIVSIATLGALLLVGCEALQKTHDTISQTTGGISTAKSDVDSVKQAKKDSDTMAADAKKASSTQPAK